jgi:hypothetical protein
LDRLSESQLTWYRIAANATAVYWLGSMQTTPSIWTACVDCTETDILVTNNDVLDWVDGSQAPPAETSQVVWSKQGIQRTNGTHVVRLRNELHEKAGAAGQLAIDSIIVTISSGTCQLKTDLLDS